MAKWYPSHVQLSSPQETERAFRETLRQLYELQDKFDRLHKQVNTPAPAQPTNTAAVTRLLGLPVEPTDTSQLANGTVLTYHAATRTFRFQ